MRFQDWHERGARDTKRPGNTHSGGDRTQLDELKRQLAEEEAAGGKAPKLLMRYDQSLTRVEGE